MSGIINTSDCEKIEMINCHCINSWTGASILLLSKMYPKTDYCDCLSKDSTSLAITVLDKASTKDLLILINDINILEKFKTRIDISLGVDLDNNQIEKIIHIDSQHYIRSIRIPVQFVYKYLDCYNFEVGAEVWDNYGAPAGLEVIDESVRTILSIMELMPKVEAVVNFISSSNPISDLEKILLLDYWLQRHIQYIKAKETVGIDGIYICNSMNREAVASDVLLNHYGRCSDIAFVAALILNHPKVNIQCRQVISRKDCFNHSWNIALCGDGEFFVDFTRNITRNKRRRLDAIQALSYCPIYTLLGKKNSIVQEYGISDIYDCNRVSPDDYDREMLSQKVKELISNGKIQAEWQAIPIVQSYKKEG